MIDPARPSTVYAALWQVRRGPWQLWSGGPGSGLFTSTDGGDGWTEITRAPGLPSGVIGKIGIAGSFYFNRLVADPVDVDTVYVLNFIALKSTDGGTTYRPLETAHADARDLWIDPENPARMISSDDGGAAVSVNRGASRTRQAYPTA